MPDLKQELIRLGSTNPELRSDIRPVLAALTNEKDLKALAKELGVEKDLKSMFGASNVKGMHVDTRGPNTNLTFEVYSGDAFFVSLNNYTNKAGDVLYLQNGDGVTVKEFTNPTKRDWEVLKKAMKRFEKTSREAGRMDTMMGTDPALSKYALEEVINDLKKGDTRSAQRTLKRQVDDIQSLSKHIDRMEAGRDMDDLVDALEMAYRRT